MNITLRQLKVFSSVVKHNSYTRAAEDLNLSQPAVSMQIKQLENQVRLPLLEHVGKKIYLTQAGQIVLQHARDVLQQIDDLDAVLNEYKEPGHGRLRIAAATTANYFAPALLRIFHERYPLVSVHLDVTNRKALLAQLAENDVDMVIMGMPPGEMDLEAGSFMENPLVVIAPPDHAFATGKKIPLRALEKEIFLVREKGSGTRQAMERFFRKHDLKITYGMEVSSDEAIKQSVQAGLGLGLMSRDAVQMELTLGRLIIPDIQRFPLMRSWYLVSRKGKHLSPSAQAFRDFVLNEAKGLLRKPPISAL
ncbi:LysR family transcriptional regulator [Varunaivibrio sulfuroxidans]|uniref:HTH-type transcriptional regulator CbbR n=1 Tax=Varunaivibrio sulfuroxidans TaxID=1773489 RepID=A0A4R3JGD7_9PROT|nr:LysR family transcriptional regulator [Varunaivibrio sulfuroxidans]TCS64276.1 LysR family transcriptional regulator [Varunaivibrio sulfuroxidans]WES31286.1 LysR family transcriptional regulator [Varunaivibrio sulfuroxidans]